MRLPMLAVFAAAAMSMAACGEAPRPAGMTVRDSAGVRIVEYAGTPPPSHSITFAQQPLFRHGNGEGEYLFQGVFVGALQPDGGAVVADNGSGEVISIGPDGTLRRVLARNGAGPDEVRQARSRPRRAPRRDGRAERGGVRDQRGAAGVVSGADHSSAIPVS